MQENKPPLTFKNTKKNICLEKKREFFFDADPYSICDALERAKQHQISREHLANHILAHHVFLSAPWISMIRVFQLFHSHVLFRRQMSGERLANHFISPLCAQTQYKLHKPHSDHPLVHIRPKKCKNQRICFVLTKWLHVRSSDTLAAISLLFQNIQIKIQV